MIMHEWGVNGSGRMYGPRRCGLRGDIYRMAVATDNRSIDWSYSKWAWHWELDDRGQPIGELLPAAAA